MIRGKIKKCKARLANNNNAQNARAKPKTTLDNLTYQRNPAGKGLDSDGVSDMARGWFKQFELSQAITPWKTR
jgi:hypothetical protein